MLMEYRITHGYLHLRCVDEGFATQIDVYLYDCISIHGPVSVGPCTLGVSRAGDMVTLTAGDDLLVVRALRVVVGEMFIG